MIDQHIKTVREALEYVREAEPYLSETRTSKALTALDALEAENARLKDLLGKANALSRLRLERLRQLSGRSINEDNSDQQGYTAGDMASAAALLRTQHAAIERKDALLRQALDALNLHQGAHPETYRQARGAITKELSK